MAVSPLFLPFLDQRWYLGLFGVLHLFTNKPLVHTGVLYDNLGTQREKVLFRSSKEVMFSNLRLQQGQTFM